MIMYGLSSSQNQNQSQAQRPSNINNGNPFRNSAQMSSIINQNQSPDMSHVTYKPKMHQRSHSYNVKNQQSNWQQLIPPLPKNQNGSDMNLDFDLNFNNDIMNNKASRQTQLPPQNLQQSSQKPQSSQFNNAQLQSPVQWNQDQMNRPYNFQKNKHHRHSMPSGTPSPVSSSHNSPDLYSHANSKDFPFHQNNSFAVRNTNEIPPFLKNQLSNQPKVTSSNSIKKSQLPTDDIGPNDSGNNTLLSAPERRPSANHSNSSSSNTSLGTPFQLSQKKSIRKKRKVCKKCGLDISGQFVRALNSSFHVSCFCCNECGNECSSKFFPYEMIDPETNLKYQVALCEYDYFKRLNLICHNCNSALRGPYITALGNKYHLEHFKCNVCQKVFESDESYYEHDSNIYCHYHYSKNFANHCEGCDSSIVKQFVELFRGGRTQQWHPECYMVNKFWNVVIKQDCVGFKGELLLDSSNGEVDEKSLIKVEQMIENLVIKCWVTLSSYEELTASSISDMLLNACIGNQFNGLLSTGRLIVFVEILFSSIDYLIRMTDSIQKRKSHLNVPNSNFDSNGNLEENDEVQIQLNKEPRNLSGKIMSYLAILRKSNQTNLSGSGSLSSELLSVITGCAHYLKLLIRIGLQSCLKINKLRNDSIASENFLNIIKTFESFQIPDANSTASPKFTDEYLRAIQSQLTIPANSTDLCFSCNKSIEKSCVRHNNLRWHKNCFKCSNCNNRISDLKKVDFDKNANGLSCLDCSGVSNSQDFENVSDLEQLIYLLKIAFLRSKQVMALDYKNKNNGVKNGQADNSTENNEIKSHYSETINDITRKRTKRQNQNLSSSIKKNARKSVVIDAPEPESGVETKMEELSFLSTSGIPENEAVNRQNSVNSNNSFNLSQNESDLFNHKKMTIKDEPVSRNISNNHLNRTSDLLKNEKSLTLDDIPRIVAAEQARDQRPNAFKHHNSLYQRQKPKEKLVNLNGSSVSNHKTPSSQGAISNRNVSNGTVGSNALQQNSTPIKTKYYSELNKDEHFILRHVALEALSQLTNNRYSKTELLPLIQEKKSNGFWDKFKFHSSNDKSNGVFGVDLQVLTKKYGVDSDLGVGPAKLRIPIVVDDLINSLKTKDMSVEGIFRLNGNIKKLKDLTEKINTSPLKSPDFTHETAVQLAALMKKWLRELPNPLLTFNLYELWIETQKQPDLKLRKRLLKLVYCMLPRSHRNLVEVLLYFFNWVSSFAEIDEESGSKMDIHNLATVISPNILYSKPDIAGEQASDSYFLAIEVVNQLIEMHEELSYIPSDLLEFFDRLESESGSSKEIMSKIEKLSKEMVDFFVSYEIKDELSDPSNQEVRSNTILRGLSNVLSEQHGETGNV